LAALGLAALSGALARALADRCLVGFGGGGRSSLHGSMLLSSGSFHTSSQLGDLNGLGD